MPILYLMLFFGFLLISSIVFADRYNFHNPDSKYSVALLLFLLALAILIVPHARGSLKTKIVREETSMVAGYSFDDVVAVEYEYTYGPWWSWEAFGKKSNFKVYTKE